MDVKDVAIATISWARNEGEERLLAASLRALTQLNAPVFITDAGSGHSFLEDIRQLPNTFLEGPLQGVWPQARKSLQAAAATRAEWIFYTEPDKLDFFKEHFTSLLYQLNPPAGTGICLASRSPQGFGSFPHFQQLTEKTINRCCAELIGKEADYVYGPFLLHRSLAPFLETLPDSIGWGWRPYIFLIAHRLGYSIQVYEGDFRCPEDQQHDDRPEKVYRMKQLAQNMEGLAAAEAAVL